MFRRLLILWLEGGVFRAGEVAWAGFVGAGEFAVADDAGVGVVGAELL